MTLSTDPSSPADRDDVERMHAMAVRLRRDPTQVNPAGWEAEFAEAPWPVKVYRGGLRWQLDGAGPPWLQPADDPLGQFSLGQFSLGRLLYLTVGATRVRYAPGGVQLSSPERPAFGQPERRLVLRRAVPSGGAMYPTEVYVVVCSGDRVPLGAYHYDPVGHQLVSLGIDASELSLAGELGAALRLPPGAPVPATVLVLTSRFWKNFHKYGDFSYRLGAVDLGVVLGRLLRLVGDGAVVHPGFDDERLDALLGLDGHAEASYAALALPAATGSAPVTAPRSWRAPRPAPPPVLERFPQVKNSAEFHAVHAAARRAVPVATARDDPRPARRRAPADSGAVALPARVPARHPLTDAIARRSSSGNRFTGASLSGGQLAAILATATESLRGLCHAWHGPQQPGLGLACTVTAVEGILPGFHLVAADGRWLHPVSEPTDPRSVLWSALHVRTLNPELAAVTVHVTGDLDLRSNAWGARAYRLQQIAVGVVVDALGLGCAELGVGAHPLLGFNARLLDSCYQLHHTGSGVLAQVCVGHTRPGLAVESSVAAPPC